MKKNILINNYGGNVTLKTRCNDAIVVKQPRCVNKNTLNENVQPFMVKYTRSNSNSIEDIINLGIDLGLTSSSFRRISYGDYVTVGVDDSNDISYTSKDYISGVTKYDLHNDARDLLAHLTALATVKELMVYDGASKKLSFREIVRKKTKAEKPTYFDCDCVCKKRKPVQIDVCPHYIQSGDTIIWVNPNDEIIF